MTTKKDVPQCGMQGDVQFKAIGALPAGVKPVGAKPLAYGETSGHAHLLTGDWELFEAEDGSKTFAKIGPKGALLQHCHLDRFDGNYLTFNEIGGGDHVTEVGGRKVNFVELRPNQVIEIGIHKKYSAFSETWQKVVD